MIENIYEIEAIKFVACSSINDFFSFAFEN